MVAERMAGSWWNGRGFLEPFFSTEGGLAFNWALFYENLACDRVLAEFVVQHLRGSIELCALFLGFFS